VQFVLANSASQAALKMLMIVCSFHRSIVGFSSFFPFFFLLVGSIRLMLFSLDQVGVILFVVFRQWLASTPRAMSALYQPKSVPWIANIAYAI
jgi:hypothetical protein